MKITFIQIGGTIDKSYPRTMKGYAFEIGEAAVGRVLDKINPNFQYEIIPLLKKDSLDITEADREKILETCRNISDSKIILTHGTDTMTETASKLSGIKDKVIVITGAMRPEKFSDSDAMFNIGVAVAAVQTLPPGIYIAMNGRVYNWDRVKRDRADGKFVESV
ncbi:MAG: asparaginase domain-containing protein [Candidatus Paceibacterota bacterium]